jgi:putative oxygen-independent coproporphyrinogen III oxidase
LSEPVDAAALDPGTDVAVYVHWPYCARICPYCDFNVVRDRGRSEEQAGLVAAILGDLTAQAAWVGPRRLASVFLGGGTPSLMAPDDVAAVLDHIHRLFPSGGPVEVTLEANPTDAEAAHFAALAQAGINRLSLGVQSLDEAALRFLGRNHSAAEAHRAIDLAGAAFGRLSIDLIHALPGQTPAAWAAELEAAVAMGFEHVSPYQLTVEPTTAFGRAAARGDWTPPDEDTAAALYETTQAVLSEARFEAYEVSNHARGVAARSAHNIHVWRGGDYLGVGPGAHGRLTLDGVRTATVSHRGIDAYVAGVAAASPWAERDGMDAVSAAEERILLGLRTVEGAPVSAFAVVGAEGRIAELAADGFLAVASGRVVATATGRPVLDAVLKALLT